MSREIQQVVLQLQRADMDALRAIARMVDRPRVEVIRWAIRYYALRGPWTDAQGERDEAIGGQARVVTGPTTLEVMP